MRSVELAKVGFAAEALRLKRLARRQAFRLAYAVAAVLFGLAAFAVLQILIYQALEAYVRPWIATLILLAIDGVVAAIFASSALNSKPDRIEREALQVRKQALGEAKRALTVMSVAGQVAGFALGAGTRRALRGSRLAQFGIIADIASRFIRRR